MLSFVLLILELAIKTATISANSLSIGILCPLTKVLAISVIIENFPLTFARQLFFNVNTSEILSPVLKAIQTVNGGYKM